MHGEGVLLDLDGTLYVDNEPLAGAVEAISTLVEQNIPRLYLTNTTRVSRRLLAERLQHMGFPVLMEEIFTAPVAASHWLRTNGFKRVTLFLPDAAREDFSDFEIVELDPDAIIVGDLGEDWTYVRMNAAFKYLLGGAKLIALQKNRFWKSSHGLKLDAGPFIAALEYAAQCEAEIIGKPSQAFFHMAAASLGLKPEHITVVGDDIETDIGGAQAAHMHGVLVRTGKFRQEVLAGSGIQPNQITNSLAELIKDWFPG